MGSFLCGLVLGVLIGYIFHNVIAAAILRLKDYINPSS